MMKINEIETFTDRNPLNLGNFLSVTFGANMT